MSQFDKDIKVGDIITAYHAGYHRVTKVERRFITADDNKHRVIPRTIGEEYGSLIYYETILNSKLNPVKKSVIRTCDAAWCTIITPTSLHNEFVAEVRKLEEKRDVLLSLFK